MASENQLSAGSGITLSEVDQQINIRLENIITSYENIIQQKNEELEQKRAQSKEQEEQKKGKPLSGFLEFTGYFSNQASTVNRSLVLGGIAIIWIFKKPEDKEIVKNLLNTPLFCLACSLALDLLQYAFGAIAWMLFYECKYSKWKKQKYPADYVKDIEAPNAISLPITILFVLKIVFMCIAYYHILLFLKDRL
ncbi:MAG: hypothetical protein ABUL44_02820 [Flavobacterium sp.]